VLPDFEGNVIKVIEKRYGKEFNPWRKDSGSYKPGVFSGWKYTYLFDKSHKLSKRIVSFNGKIQNTCTYLNKTERDRKINLEKTTDYFSGQKESTIEYENFIDQDGKIRKVNFREQISPESSKDLFMFETNAEYNKNKLNSFIRYTVSEGDTASGEKCLLTYDSSGRLKRIDRKDISSGFTTTIQYHYNGKGQVSHYSIDLLTEIQEYGRTQIQNLYFKYDNRGNWTRMYRRTGKKNNLEAKRTIRYN
jgi:YD repeat-containing protein